MKPLITLLREKLEYFDCEISKTNNQYKHGRRHEHARLKPIYEKLIACVEALEWISGNADKPYTTYYERVLADNTIVPPYFDIATEALSSLREEVGE